MTSPVDYWSLVEPYWEAISIYGSPTEFLEAFNAAPERSRNLFASHWCQSEVCNGGFAQFFYNSTGILAPEAVSAFRAIGLSKTAAVVESAMSIFDATYPRDRFVREGILEAWAEANPDTPDPFSHLNEEFFALMREENSGWEAAANRYASGG